MNAYFGKYTFLGLFDIEGEQYFSEVFTRRFYCKRFGVASLICMRKTVRKSEARFLFCIAFSDVPLKENGVCGFVILKWHNLYTNWHLHFL